MKKGIIISGSLAQDHEFIYPYYRLLEENVKLDVCLHEGKPVVGLLGTVLPPNKEQEVKKIEDIKVKDYDVLVLPGGVKAMEKVRQNKDIIKFSEENKINLNELVFNGGEEFELVFTVTPKNLKKIHRLAKKNKINIFEIGHVSKGNGVFFDDGNESFRIKDNGWRHFR